MRLSEDEANLLMKIAALTKMDCWFSIRSNKQGLDYVYDLESRRRMSLRSGVRLLLEGAALLCGQLLSHDECVVMLGLTAKLL